MRSSKSARLCGGSTTLSFVELREPFEPNFKILSRSPIATSSDLKGKMSTELWRSRISTQIQPKISPLAPIHQMRYRASLQDAASENPPHGVTTLWTYDSIVLILLACP